MKIFLTCLFLIISTSAFSWEFSAKTDAERSSTNNVNLTNTNPVSDSFTTLGGYLQTKDDVYKIKLKGRLEKYQKQTENDNYSLDLSLQFKRNKLNDYTGTIFKQVYNGTPLLSTDTTSDNSGGRLSTTFRNNFDKSNIGYFSLTGTYKKYSKIAGRNDKIINAGIGLEHTVSEELLISPEISIQKNSSSDSYYSNTSFGPMILVSYIPNEKWDLYFFGTYAFTKYNGRTAASIVRRRTTVYEEEYQKLLGLDFGADYSLNEYLSLQGKLSTSNNTSNNQTSAYKANIISFGLAIKL